LPEGVLQHIFIKASSWQTPGPCLSSRVCRTWRAAAAGCKGIRLLYHAGLEAPDQSLAAWLACGSQQLVSFTLDSSSHAATEQVLGALATAATQAAAAGQPLPLHTLRVLGRGPPLDLIGRLLAALPPLRCLRMSGFKYANGSRIGPSDASEVQQHLAPLQHATQLQELHLPVSNKCTKAVAGLLPLSLQRVQWRKPSIWDAGNAAPDLSHLPQLTSLDLLMSCPDGLTPRKLPPGLKEFAGSRWFPPEGMVQERPQLFTDMKFYYQGQQGLQGSFAGSEAWAAAVSGMSNLRRLSVPDVLLEDAADSWEGNLQQLQVLHVMVYDMLYEAGDRDTLEQQSRDTNSRVRRWLWCAMLPMYEGGWPAVSQPQLLLLLVTGMCKKDAASMGMRRCLQRRVCSSRCEVVVAESHSQEDFIHELAGLPE
jgi:hypothetical protein